MTRRSPIQHTVRPHKRGRVQVASYTRGSGQKPSKIPRRVSHTTRYYDDGGLGPKGFTVNLTYSDSPGDGETVVVIADSYKGALKKAVEERVDNRQPIEVELIDPDLGQILTFVAEGTKKVAKKLVGAGKVAEAYANRGSVYALKGIAHTGEVGGKYAVRAGIGVGNRMAKSTGELLSATSKLVISDAEKRVVQVLLQEAYSPVIHVRVAARYQLKKYYPAVFEIAHFKN